jgi:hypothetical protein
MESDVDNDVSGTDGSFEFSCSSGSNNVVPVSVDSLGTICTGMSGVESIVGSGMEMEVSCTGSGSQNV